MLVGHEPLLSSFAAHLLAGQRAGKLTLELKKGSLCHIETETFSAGAPAKLHWLLTPKQLRWLG